LNPTKRRRLDSVLDNTLAESHNTSNPLRDSSRDDIVRLVDAIACNIPRRSDRPTLYFSPFDLIENFLLLMTSMLVRGGDVGRHAYSHTSSSGGEEIEGHGVAHSRRERLADKRRAAKLMTAAARAGNSRKRARARTPGESDSSEEEAAGEADEADSAANDVDGSDDDDEEPEAFAPSGAAYMGTRSKTSKSRSTSKFPFKSAATRGLGVRARQAGHIGRKTSSRLSSRFESRKRRRTNPEEALDTDDEAEAVAAAVALVESAEVSESDNKKLDDADCYADDSSDDEIYQVLDFISDSDEDDSEVELIEEAAIIVEEMQTTDDPLDIGYADFVLESELSSFAHAVPSEFDWGNFAEITANLNWTEPLPIDETTEVIPPSSVPTAPVSVQNSPRPQDMQATTGLQTPTSLKRPMELDGMIALIKGPIAIANVT
jgi:hypothetical protein